MRLHKCIRTSTCARTQTHMHTYTQKYIHTYTHTHRQVREHPKVCGHKPRPDALSALVRAMVHHCCGLHFSGSQLYQGISTVTSPLPSPGACTACSSCVRVLCTFLRVPCPHLYVRQPACVGRYCLPMSACGACAGFLCTSALHLFACASPVPARVLCLALD